MSIIQHLENHYGTFVCNKGMRQIPKSLYNLCQKIVKFYFNKSVEEIVKNKIAKGVIIDDKLIEFDNIISNVDINLTYKKLLNNSKYSCNKENMSSSAIIFLGINREFKDLDLHNILFSNNKGRI